MAAPPSKPEETEEWINIRTTVPTKPLPPLHTRPSLKTERVLLRPLTNDDLDGAYALRTQPEVMIHSSAGCIDQDLETTRIRMKLYTPPNDAHTYNYAICVPKSTAAEFEKTPCEAKPDENGDEYVMIGIGGLHRSVGGPLGWPEIGYMIKHEYWGKGFMTETLKGFLKLYRDLPRPSEPQPLRVTRRSVPDWNGEDGAVVEEKAVAITVDYNSRSHRVLQKSGFEEYFSYEVPDLHDPSKTVTLRIFQYLPGRVLKEEEEAKKKGL